MPAIVSHSSSLDWAQPSWLHRHPDDAGLAGHEHGPLVADHPVPLGLRRAAEPPLVDRLGDEPADAAVHAVGAAEEDAELRRDGGVPVQQVLEAREAGLAGMAALHRLAELHLVAHQDQVPGRKAHGDRVRQGDLPRLVDEEVVERAGQLLAAEDPRGAADQHRARRQGAPATSPDSSGWIVALADQRSSSSPPAL